MAPVEEPATSELATQPGKVVLPPKPPKYGGTSAKEVDEWAGHVDEVSAHIQSILDGTITDFDAFDRQMGLKDRAKQIREEEADARRERFFLYGTEGKGEGTRYKWWCQRCFVEYHVDLPGNVCTRCQQADKMMTQASRREELMGKVETFKEDNARHKWRKDKWLRWKKSQAILKRSRNINYKAWEYWEPDTDSENEGDPIVPRDNPEFLAMEADMKERQKKGSEKKKTAEKCRQRGNQCMKEGDYVGAIEHYDEGLEYNRSSKALWTNKALAELKVFRWHDAVASCNKVIEYAEIFEDGFTKSADSCFKAFMRRASALRALHRWSEALADLEDAVRLFPKDKEARELHAKTKAADEEERRAKALRQPDPEKTEPPPAPATTTEGAEEPATAAAPPAPPPAVPQRAAGGPVRVAIEEESDEEGEAGGQGEDQAALASPARRFLSAPRQPGLLCPPGEAGTGGGGAGALLRARRSREPRAQKEAAVGDTEGRAWGRGGVRALAPGFGPQGRGALLLALEEEPGQRGAAPERCQGVGS
jgi:tetratricopeptide (TPR) repeat protein